MTPVLNPSIHPISANSITEGEEVPSAQRAAATPSPAAQKGLIEPDPRLMLAAALLAQWLLENAVVAEQDGAA